MPVLKQIADRLRRLFRANARPAGDPAAASAARLERNVLALVGNMPTLPDCATRAVALADRPDSTFIDLARLVEADAAIAADLLRIANSAFYTGGAPAAKLPQALMRLGMLQCKNLIVSIGMKSLLWKMAQAERRQCELLWQHGHVTGSLCRRLNRSFRLGFEGEEFSAGLLHDLGRVLLLLADPDCFARAGAMSFDEGPDLLERERAAIGIDHSALGGWFGEHSRLPEALVQAMRLHHEPGADSPSAKLVALVAAADHMANHLQTYGQANGYDVHTNPGLAHLWARWPPARKERLVGELSSILAECAHATAGEGERGA